MASEQTDRPGRYTWPMTSLSTAVQRLRERREALVRAWDIDRGIVLIPSGLPIPIAGTDLYHDFHAHNEHYYLSGIAHSAAVLAFDPSEGWTLFASQISREEQVWTNASEPLESQHARSGVDRVLENSQLQSWLERRRGEPIALAGNHDLLHNPAGYGVESFAALELEIDDERSDQISSTISEHRRAKDEVELGAMRAAAEASVAGHFAGIRKVRPGMTERQLQIEIEAEFFRNGGARTAYGSIVGGGPNGAILHFAPTGRAFGEDEIILVDAGAEIDGYASDVSRTFPAGRAFTPLQADLYDLVLATQQHAIDTAGPGVEYKDLHMQAALDIAAGLRDLDILRGDPESLVDSDAHALFFPHGLGHMLGLATHDVGGCLAGRQSSDRFGLKYLRADLPLQPGYVVTIEPGIYFIRALLTDPERRQKYREAVNWDRVDTMLDFGGIRIEDDALIAETGVELLSGALPRDRKAIEELRREGLDE
jgi:Xaa-Pro aminopeptidase